MSWEIKLIYFKDSGKYYSEGTYRTEKTLTFEVFAEVRSMLRQGNWPGLIEGQHEFTALVEPGEDYPNGYPSLIFPEGICRIKNLGTRIP